MGLITAIQNWWRKRNGKATPTTTIDFIGTKYWYINDKLHRDEIDPETGLSLPAAEYSNGDKYWYINGKCHREDGPAVEYADGRTRYWINNKYIPQLENKRIYGKEKLAKLLILI